MLIGRIVSMSAVVDGWSGVTGTLFVVVVTSMGSIVSIPVDGWSGDVFGILIGNIVSTPVAGSSGDVVGALIGSIVNLSVAGPPVVAGISMGRMVNISAGPGFVVVSSAEVGSGGV